MPAVLGTKAHPIIIRCADVSKTSDKADECIIKEIQRRVGLQGKVFKDRRYKYVAIVIKKNNCDSCPMGLNICKVETLIIPKKAVDEYKQKIAIAM